ncbi:MAG: hypothetical protein PQJ45_02350 [Sphaerochaetaceae bacterium]|nr:hypothetical protein [Sphaerochaetaceae bacterium]MDC7236596.1 hypothetical protein [Sphaerochaetaceae bacterium]
MATKKQQKPPIKKENKEGEVKEEIESKSFSKNKVIVLTITFFAILIIVYIAFLGMGKRPVEKLSKEQALETLIATYGADWVLDDYGISYPLAQRNQDYQRISFTTDLDRENLVLPIFLYLDKEEEIIGREMAIIYFDEESSLLKAEFPTSKIYDFVYSKAKDGKMENIIFIGEENQRTYYIKDSVVVDENE